MGHDEFEHGVRDDEVLTRERTRIRSHRPPDGADQPQEHLFETGSDLVGAALRNLGGLEDRRDAGMREPEAIEVLARAQKERREGGGGDSGRGIE